MNQIPVKIHKSGSFIDTSQLDELPKVTVKEQWDEFMKNAKKTVVDLPDFDRGRRMTKIIKSYKPDKLAKILNGEIIIDIAKTFPKELPCEVFMYCAKKESLKRISGNGFILVRFIGAYKELNGLVVGKFTVEKVDVIEYETIEDYSGDIEDVCMNNQEYEKLCKNAYLDYEEMNAYSNGGNLLALHITNLVIFDEPKKLSDYYNPNLYMTLSEICKYEKNTGDLSSYRIHKAPQSWQYVKEVE